MQALRTRSRELLRTHLWAWVAARVLFVLGATWLLYIFLANVFIGTPLLRKIVSKEDDVLMEYGSAWTVWPGRVHVRNFRLRTKNKDMEMMISIDAASASIDLVSVFTKNLLVRDLVANGASVRVRPRYYQDEVDPKVIEGFPPIDGFPEVPLRPMAPRTSGLEEHYTKWTFDLEGVNAQLREVWIAAYRFHGDAQLEGGLYLRPARKLALSPTHVEVKSGDLVLQKRLFAVATKGSIDCTVKMHDPRAVDGVELLRYFTMRLRLESDLDDFAFAQRWLEPVTKTVVSGGRGHAKSDVSVLAGVIQDGSRFDLDAKDFAARHPLVSGDLNSKLRVGVDKGELRATLELDDVHVRRRYAESWPLTAGYVGLVAKSRALDLANKPFDDLLVSLDIPKAVLVDVRALQDLLGPKVFVGKTKAELQLHLDFSVHEVLLQGKTTIAFPDASMIFSGVAMKGDLRADAEVVAFDPKGMRAKFPRLAIDLRNVMVAANADPPPPWWGHVEMKDGTLEKVDDAPRLKGGLFAKVKDARPITHIFAAKGKMPSWAEGLLSLDGLTATARLEAGGKVIAIEDGKAEGGAFELAGRYRKDEGGPRGELYIGKGPLGVTIGIGKDKGISPSIGGGPKTP